ncbi:hypothetical protein [Arenicella xantha]|uniref:Uncharacterized protein n=1 Tax=Arenicella xantha TaxID=644221 RepID=A0A395JN92_9GAMM|nr:hypothetical protein [Arenicella xantha]RBP51054.1 hypothetical protein DFR28_102473 [Arenicella xantha]
MNYSSTYKNGSTKRVGLLISLLLATTLSFSTSAFGQQDTRALTAVISLLLFDGPTAPNLQSFPEPIFYTTDGPITLSVGNTGGPDITDCSVSPALPQGLSIQISADAKTCEIVGTPGTTHPETEFTITATNAVGSDLTTVSLIIFNGPAILHGFITYDRIAAISTPSTALDYANITQQPVRGATIELLDSANTVLQTKETLANGEYLFDIPQNQPVRLRVRAELLKTSGAQYDVKVVDNTSADALYTLAETSPSLISATGTRNLNANAGWGQSSYTGVRAAAPFAILDSIYEAISDIVNVDPSVVFPPLVVNWSVNNAPTSPQNLAAGAIGTSFYGDGKLYILGKENSDTDEFDDHIILHEWGHYFEDKLSRSDSPGGDHGDADRVDMRVAFGEGFGNALSGIITDDPIYVDTSGSEQASGFIIDVEQNSWTNPGWYSEGSVQSILYDLYDSADDGPDTVSLGLAPIYNVLVNEQKNSPVYTSIFSFISALKANNAAQAAGISAIVDGQSIVGSTIDATGSTETNNADVANNVLPVYTSITVGGSAVNVCTITQFNSGSDGNKLSNYRFLTFNVPFDGNYTVEASKTPSTNQGMDTDPELDIVHNGVSKFKGNSTDVDFEQATGALTSGDHVMSINDYNIENGASGVACFDISIFSSPN